MEIPSTEKTNFATRKLRDLRCRSGDELVPSSPGCYSIEKPNEVIDLNECWERNQLSEGHDGKILRDLGHSTCRERSEEFFFNQSH